jgi:hypothetical protein
VQQHEADRVGDRDEGGGVAGAQQAVPDLLQHPVVIGEDDVFLGPEVPEERRAAEAGPPGDVIDGGLLVPVLVEQGQRGFREPVAGRWLGHGPSSWPAGWGSCHLRADAETEYLLFEIEYQAMAVLPVRETPSGRHAISSGGSR